MSESRKQLLEHLTAGVRVAAVTVGVTAIAAGLVFAVFLAGRMWALIDTPERSRAAIEAWARMIDAKGLAITIQGQEFAVGGMAAVACHVLTLLLLAWLSLGLMVSGGRAISWVLYGHPGLRRAPREGEAEPAPVRAVEPPAPGAPDGG